MRAARAAVGTCGLVTLGSWGSSTWRTAVRDGECTTAETMARISVDTASDLRLVLNVPAFRLDVVDSGRVIRSIRVSVGQPKYRTPLGHFRMDYMVWNPWWRPPSSEWARKERPHPPGWANPVGRVKLHVTGLVFLHGTPLEGSLGSAASHACVRMRNDDAIALARLVHSRAGAADQSALIDSLIADTTRTMTLTLAVAVPVDMQYVLAEVRDHELVVYRDVYDYAGRRVADTETQAILALRESRGTSVRIARARLRALARAARDSVARAPIDSLLLRVPEHR